MATEKEYEMLKSALHRSIRREHEVFHALKGVMLVIDEGGTDLERQYAFGHARKVLEGETE